MYLYNDKSHCLTCEIHNSPLEDSIIRRYTNVVYCYTYVNLKLAFPKVVSSLPHYLTDLPPPRAPVQVTAYSDDITIISTHTSTSAAKKYIQLYLHKVFAWTKQNDLTLNPEEKTCTLFTPDPAKYTSHLDLKINNTALHMATHPKVLGLTLDPQLTYSTHIHNTSQYTPTSLYK